MALIVAYSLILEVSGIPCQSGFKIVMDMHFYTQLEILLKAETPL
jgi:hypothetical protein